MKLIKAYVCIFFIFVALYPQYYYFGRNKIQYTKFDWHVLKTKHFDIYYYPEMEEFVEIGARIAEEAYLEYQSRFEHHINREVPLIFYSSHLHFQQTNVIPYFIPEGTGGFFEFIKGRVVIPADGSYSQFRHAIRHELVHVFFTSKVNSILIDRQKLDHPFPPLWFNEGLAEYFSIENRRYPDMVLRDAVLKGYLRRITEIGEITGSYLMYKEGESFLRFLTDKFGKDIILRIIENVWVDEDFTHVIEFVTGSSIEDLQDEWMLSLQKRLLTDIKDKESARSRDVKLTERGFNVKPAVYSSSDTLIKVLFISNRSGYADIYAKSLGDKSNLEIIVRGERTHEYEAFHLMRSRMDVHGNRLAFVTKKGEHDVIHIFDLKAGRNLFDLEFPNLTAISSPKFSADGKRLLFSALDFGGYADIYFYDFDNSLLVRLTDDIYNDSDPIWLPDARGVIFCSDRGVSGKDGFMNLFSFNIVDKKIAPLTCGMENDISPSLSPDARELLFCSNREGKYDLYVLPLDEGFTPGELYVSGVYRITSYTGDTFDPVWVNDSTIVYTLFEDYSFNIMLRYLDEDSLAYVGQNYSVLPEVACWKPERLSGDRVKTRQIYRGKYSLDIAQGQLTQDPFFGSMGGAQIAISDVLGDRRYEILIYNNARTKSEFMNSFNFFIGRYSLGRRTNFGYGMYRFSGERFNYYEGFYDEKRVGAFFVLQYPITHFNRFENVVNLAYSQKDWYDWRGVRKAWIVENHFSYVYDNSIWGLSGPVDGSRFIVTLGYVVDVRYSNVSYYTVIADFRRYFRLRLYLTYAVRVAGFVSEGKEAQRFYIGGSWTLRGYPLFSIWGNHCFLFNQELRFPFITSVQLRFPRGKVNLGGIQGALFVDAGDAWESGFPGLRGSFGIGFRINIGGYLVLRYDIGRRTDFRKISKSTFYQFFFGWDF